MPEQEKRSFCPFSAEHEELDLRALVTGANGFIGCNLVRKLLEEGWEVRGLTQPGTSRANLEGLNVELCEGDLTIPSSLEEAVRGRDIVFHLAALVRDWGRWKDFQKVNVDGTENLLKAGKKAGVKRFIHTSSLAVHPFRPTVDGHESLPADNMKYPYTASKVRSEELVRRFCNEAEMEFVIIRPGDFIYGPYDTTAFAKIAENLSKITFINGGRAVTCYCYVGNLVQAYILAAGSGRASGQTFIITDGVKISWKDLLSKVALALGENPPKRSFPLWPAKAAAWIYENLFYILGSKGEPLITRFRVDVTSTDFHFTGSKAREELGFEPSVDLEEGLRRTVEWYRRFEKGREDTGKHGRIS
jgi:nucleoside-diphosphate-sugar epimerase